MGPKALLLGVDGGGTGCRARLADPEGGICGEGAAGPANIRFGVEAAMAAVLDATGQCLAAAGLRQEDADIVACLALAGASEPNLLAAAHTYPLPFRHACITNDAYAACIGAHGGEDGGVIAVGTGSIGWALVDGREHRVGGWGFPVSDEGSGAWLGCEAARRVLWAHDGRIHFTPMLTALHEGFEGSSHAIVAWMGAAGPRDFATLAPTVIEHARRGDAAAVELMRLAASHIDAIARRLEELGAHRLALAGGIAPSIEAWLHPQTQALLVPAKGDALSGALQIARREAEALARRRPLQRHG